MIPTASLGRGIDAKCGRYACMFRPLGIRKPKTKESMETHKIKEMMPFRNPPLSAPPARCKGGWKACQHCKARSCRKKMRLEMKGLSLR